MPRARKPPKEHLDDLRTQFDALWPAAKGSLNHVRKPCTRPGCPACASGRKHPVWLYTFRLDGRRRCVYVPEDRVAALQQALANGRELERLLCRCGQAVVAREDDWRTPAP